MDVSAARRNEMYLPRVRLTAMGNQCKFKCNNVMKGNNFLEFSLQCPQLEVINTVPVFSMVLRDSY